MVTVINPPQLSQSLAFTSQYGGRSLTTEPTRDHYKRLTEAWMLKLIYCFRRDDTKLTVGSCTYT